MELLKQNIEALIFASEQSISVSEIQECLKSVYGWELTAEQVSTCIAELKEKYLSDDFSFELNEIAGGFQFLSKPPYFAAIQVFIQQKNKKRLSTAALETLAIIAYKQPISKADIEHIRGVNCDYSIQKLLEKDLIALGGKSDAPGKPILYITSQNFMDYFGLKDPKDLPKLKDIQQLDVNEIGTPSETMDTGEGAITLSETVDEMPEENVVSESSENDLPPATDTASDSEPESPKES